MFDVSFRVLMRCEDHIHPDWEAKLAAVRAAVARRANRRIIMRQVGDRLIPIGVTSGRVHAIPAEEGGSENVEGSGERGSRRRRRHQNQDINQFLGTVGLGGQDLEEVCWLLYDVNWRRPELYLQIMVMEAMRLSLLEHEAQQRRQKEEEEKRQKEEAAAAAAIGVEAAQGEHSGGRSSEAAAPSIEPAVPPALVPSDNSASQPGLQAGSLPRSEASTPSIVRASSPSPSRHLSPSSDPVNSSSQGGRSSGRSTPSSPHGVISAAVLSASSTASAVASPSPELEPSNPLESEPTDTGSSSSAPPTGSQTPPTVVVDSEPAHTDTSSDDHTTDRPVLDNAPSFGSLAAPSSYDVLPSSPESTVLTKPLLDIATLPTSVSDGEPGASAAT